MSPPGPPWSLHLSLPDPGSNIPQEEEVEQIVYSQGEHLHRKRRAVIAPLLIGTGITAALDTGIGDIATSAHFYYKLSQEFNEDMEQVMEFFVSIQRQINSLASCCEVAQSCPILCNPKDCSLPGLHPWDFPGKNTRVGCHFLLH